VEWEHRDPSNATFRVTAVGGSLLQFAELDPTNADAGMHAPLISPEPRDDSGTSLLPYGSFMSARTGLGTSYRVDGIIVSADYFMMQLDSLFHGSSLQMAEYTGRASAPRLRNYEVARYNGRLKVDFGLNKDRAISEALETNSTLIRNWVVNDNWAFASTLFPQDTDRRLTTDEASALRNGIAGLLSDPNCQAFINELLSKVAEQKNDLPFSMDPLKLFDAINGKGGYNYSSQYGYNTALSTLKYSNAAVLLVPRSAFGPAT
jgi:hypothetical protein